MEKTLKITPDMFINGPYTLCNNCNTENLGILMVSGGYCSQRCRKCFFDDGFKLPEISKKIIYLDQFAISNLMKSINVAHPSYGNDDLIIWKEIFEQLDKLSHLRLIVCPYSDIHEQESVLTNKTYLPSYESLKRMCNHLSHGKGFKSIYSTRHTQLYNHFKSYIKKTNYKAEFTNDDVFHGNINEWGNNVFIAIKTKFYENLLEDLFEDRKEIHESIKEVFNNVWKVNKPSFIDQYTLEGKAEGKRIITNYLNSIGTYDKVEKGEITVEESIGSLFGVDSTLMHSFFRLLDQNGITEKKEHIEIIINYFINSDLSNIPYINIHSALWGQIAYLGGKNQISIPNQGMSNDIDVISNYLPYCDVMLVDGGLKKILNDNNVKDKLSKYSCNIFSGKKQDILGFLEYLKSIEKGASSEHKDYVKKVYGKYEGAYYSMYDEE